MVENVIGWLDALGEVRLRRSVLEDGLETYVETYTDVDALRKTYTRRLRNAGSAVLRAQLERLVAALDRIEARTVLIIHVKTRTGVEGIVFVDQDRHYAFYVTVFETPYGVDGENRSDIL